MKNLSIKKVALGIFLAGYAATSAYADIGPAISTNSIKGNAPTIFHPTDDTKQRRMVVRITDDTVGTTPNTPPVGGTPVRAKVGNYVHIFYRLKDADGDTDNNTDQSVKSSLKVYKRMTGSSTWDLVSVNPVSDVSGEDGHIYFQIPQTMAGAQYIGFTLQEVTPYGDPKANKWLRADNIWKNTPPEVTDSAETPSSPDIGPGDPDPNNPVGPIISDRTKLGIFKDDGTGKPDYSTNLADPTLVGNTNPEANPKYGDKLFAVAWLPDDSHLGENKPDLGASTPLDIDQSIAYNFTWSLDGTADGVVANSEAITIGVSSDTTRGWGIIELKNRNSEYDILNGGAYNAGIQGFNLKVTGR